MEKNKPSSCIKSGFGFDDDQARVAIHSPDLPAEVDARLGLFEQGEVSQSAYELRLRDSVQLIQAVWDFCYQDQKGKFVEITTPNQLQVVLRRFLVLTLMFRPDRLAKHSLRSLCKLLPLDVTNAFKSLSRVPLSKIGLMAAAQFEFQSRVQKPKHLLEIYAESAKTGHDKRKAKKAEAEKKAKRAAARLKTKSKSMPTPKKGKTGAKIKTVMARKRSKR